MSAMELFLDVSLAIVVIMVAAHGCGYLMRLIGQPKVVGEMVAGILLGPSLLGAIAPEAQAELFTNDVKNSVFVLSNLGLAFYMFLIGCELDLKGFNRDAVRKAAFLSFSGIGPALIMGALCGYALYESLSLKTVAVGQFSFFLGAALSVTAFPMLARILEERRLTHTSIGALSLIAASIDDAMAWCFLALITAMAHSSSMLAGLYPLLGGVGFAVISWYWIRPMMRRLGGRGEARGHLLPEEFAIVLTLLMGAVWFTDWIGIYSVFGGFILGLSMPRQAVFMRSMHQGLHGLTVVFLLPMFFTNSGLNTNVLSLFDVTLLTPFAVILVTAFAAKYGACTLAMRSVGHSWREASAIGGLFNARGLMLLIFVNIGIAHQLISQNLFSMLVIMAIVTTAAAMPIFNASVRGGEREDVSGPTVGSADGAA